MIRNNDRTLSKQTTFNAPHGFMLLVLMQNMFDFLSRACAKTIPTVMAAGKAGGTTIVTRSRPRTNTINMGNPFCIWNVDKRFHYSCAIVQWARTTKPTLSKTSKQIQACDNVFYSYENESWNNIKANNSVALTLQRCFNVEPTARLNMPFIF